MSKKKHCLFQLWLSKEFPFLGYGEGELTEVDNGEFVVVTKQRIDPSAVTMGEPV